MPTNFTGNLETQAAPNMISERPVADYSRNILAAGQALSSLGDMFKTDQSEAALGSISGEIADVEAQAIQYQADYADLVEQLRTATADADANVINDISGRLASLKAGRVQGRLSQVQARLATLNIVKTQGSAYPALAIKIRAMANESMDNVREVNNELFEDDPITKVSRGLMEEALKLNTTPAAISARNNSMATAEMTLKQLDLRQKTGDLTKDAATQGVQTASFEEAKASSHDLAIGWMNAIRNNATLTEAAATNEIAAVKDSLLRKYTGELIGRGAYDKAGLESALAPAFALLDNLEKLMKSTGGTVEEKTKLAKDLAEFQAANQRSEVLGLGSMLGGIFKYMPESATFEAIQAAAQVEMSLKNGKFGMGEWDEQAMRAAGQGELGLGLGLMILRSDQGKAVLGQIMGQIIYGGPAPAGADDPVLNATAKRGVDEMLGKTRNPAERAAIASNAINSFDWLDLQHNPNMRLAVQDDPALLDKAMNKAGGFASAWLNRAKIDPTAITVNHSDPQNPFSIKGESKGTNSWYDTFQNRKPTYAELETLPISERLNFMYLDILNTYGAAGVDKWLDELDLGSTNAANRKSMPGADAAKKKVTTEPKTPAPKEYAETMSEAERKHGLPSGILEAVAYQESRYNPNARSPKGALGIMQIMPQYHDTDPLNPKAAIDYAGGYLARLYEQFGDWEKALAAYNWGEGNMRKIENDPNWFDRLPRETKNYVTNIARG